MKIIAVTSCPTGIAHSEMAAESLENAAEDRDIDLKVEVRGSMGAENELTDADIEAADVVILATDISVPTDRFEGMDRIKVGVQDAVKDPDEVLDRAIAEAEGREYEPEETDTEDGSETGAGQRSGLLEKIRKILEP